MVFLGGEFDIRGYQFQILQLNSSSFMGVSVSAAPVLGLGNCVKFQAQTPPTIFISI